MAAGKKKKTKPVSNPARTVATTSLPSKASINYSKKDSSAEASDVVTPVAADAPVLSEHSNKIELCKTQFELHELSPEELEAQLEASELQQFVERLAPKVRKESSRIVSRLETDKRILRGQAEFISVREWLPDELMEQILEFTREEYDLDRENSNLPVGDDLLAKIWTLRCCLSQLLDLSLSRLNNVLGWILSHPPSQEIGNTWGLEEALEWLTLHPVDGELVDYDVQKQVKFNYIEQLNILPSEEREASSNDASAQLSSPNYAGDDSDVSELNSDVEPEALLSSYLKTKCLLYELEPAFTENTKRKTGQSMNRSPVPRTLKGKKLQKKLQKIESDVLFDLPKAQAEWATKKVEMARQAAERKKFQLPTKDSADSQIKIEKQEKGQRLDRISGKPEIIGLETNNDSGSEDEHMLGGIFTALPGVYETEPESINGAQPNFVTIRDFGRISGMHPKRVLEEACKSRDPTAKCVYTLASPTTYACRHSLGIEWSRDQDGIDAPYCKDIEVRKTARRTTFTAIRVATPDSAQSEAYIATVALFVIFSASPKEEKAHLRLPPAFRDLWDELVTAKQDHGDSADREILKELRILIDRHKPSEGDSDGDVVLYNSRLRSTAASAVDTPVPELDAINGLKSSQELKDMWSSKVAAPSYQKMLSSRMNLPIFLYRDAILDAIDQHQVSILVSQTGSGKSTQLPAFILEHELSQGQHAKIYVTEPRRISAISLAQRVSQEMGEVKNDLGTIGSLVGYAVRLESQISSSTRLIYATTGILLRMLESAVGLGDITHLVIDEVHERSIETDFLLIMVRSLLQRKPNLKVVLMSATVDAQRFSQYLDGAPIIDIPGRTFPVQAYYLEDALEITGHTNEDASEGILDEDSEGTHAENRTNAKDGQLTGYSRRTISTLTNYNEYKFDYALIVKLIQRVAFNSDFKEFSKAILIFCPGIAEIRKLSDLLASHPAFVKSWTIHALHSSFSSEDQQAAFEIPQAGHRKIVLATNIAETGITIPDITCVIDAGKHKEMRFDEKRQMSRLVLSFISKANAKQRQGRAGRVQNGICFHLFTKYRHDKLMSDNQTPEMLRLSLQDLVMRVKLCKLGSIEYTLSQALDPPSTKNIRRAIDALIEVDALSPSEELTPLGQQLARLPLDAQLGKLVLFGALFGCLDSTLTAAATLTSKSPFLSPMNQKKQAETFRSGFKRGNSDLLTAYNAYCAWRKVCESNGMSERQFCDRNYLSSQALANIEDLKAQLLSSLVDAGFVTLGAKEKAALTKIRLNNRNRNFVMLPEKYIRFDNSDTIIQSVIAWSFYPKLIKREGKGWRNIANNQNLSLHPTSVNKMGLPSNVNLLSFYSIMQSSSRFTNVQESTPAPELALVLLAGEANFNLFAGVIVIDGNRLRYKVKDWKTMVVLRTLRMKFKQILGRLFKHRREPIGKDAWIMEAIMTNMFEKYRKT